MPRTAISELSRAVAAAVESFSAQPTLPPSQIMPVRLATTFLMAISTVFGLLGSISQVTAAVAPVAAATAQPQRAERLPVWILT